MIKEYKKDEVTILWDVSICTHSAVCAKGLPTVFKPREKPWIQTDNETKERIVEQVLKCPSKAISIKGQ